MSRLNLEQRDQASGTFQMTGNGLNSSKRNFTIIYTPSKRFNTTNSTDNRACSGRSRVTTSCQNRYILGEQMNNRLTRAKQVAHQTIVNHQRLISDDTVRRRLIANNIRCRRWAKGPILTILHRYDGLQSTILRQNWRHQQWKNINFSDESRYSITNAKGRTRVCWRSGKRLTDECNMERDSWDGKISGRGAESIFTSNFVIFQNIGTCRMGSLAT